MSRSSSPCGHAGDCGPPQRGPQARSFPKRSRARAHTTDSEADAEGSAEETIVSRLCTTKPSPPQHSMAKWGEKHTRRV